VKLVPLRNIAVCCIGLFLLVGPSLDITLIVSKQKDSFACSVSSTADGSLNLAPSFFRTHVGPYVNYIADNETLDEVGKGP